MTIQDLVDHLLTEHTGCRRESFRVVIVKGDFGALLSYHVGYEHDGFLCLISPPVSVPDKGRLEVHEITDALASVQVGPLGTSMGCWSSPCRHVPV